MLNIYCINLDHRVDRWEESVKNFAAHDLPPEAVRRWSAVADADFGALGCAKSHVAALAHFLTRESGEHCLILEDDFDFVRSWQELVSRFSELTEARLAWDALLLTGASVVANAAEPPGVARLIEAQTTGGYLVSRQYASIILACFAEVIPQMEAFRHIRPREFIASRLAIDQVWKRLQRRDRWYIFSPAFGRQRASFSDIEQRVVDYDTQTYGLLQG